MPEGSTPNKHIHIPISGFSPLGRLVRKVEETLIPALRALDGFEGYYLIDSGGGSMTSIGLFQGSAQGEESTRLVAEWFRDEQFESALPTPPTITTGTVVAHKNAAQRAVAAAV